ncbi:MAG TPA: DUF6159 family protein [Anaerolineaceae bacterium]|nr:DUF6159 family protein [Anaerolineaceae bacterium]HPN52677.1 DUF6159 family protein [Anaerolineaceae bacterium]
MWNRLVNSWELVKASYKVLMADKELVIFPIISSIGLFIVSLAFLVPMALGDMFSQIAHDGFGIIPLIIAFAFYIVQYFVIFYCNTALVGAALIRLRGGDPTVGDGLRIASSRFVPLLGYALIAATVGMILKALSDKSNGLGRLVINLIGMAWNIATFLVVPILAVENVGPIEAIKRSVTLLKKTWGEQVAGNFGIGTIFGILTFIIILLALGGAAIGLYFESIPLLIAFVAVAVVGLMVVGLIQSTLTGIYVAAVYRYAVDGEVGAGFDPAMIQGAFTPRK